MLTSMSLVLHSSAWRLGSISLLVNERKIKAAAISWCQDGCSLGATQNLLFGVTVGKTSWYWVMNHRENCGPGLRHLYRQLLVISYTFPFFSAIFLLLTHTCYFRTHTYRYHWKPLLFTLMAVTLIFCFWFTQNLFYFFILKPMLCVGLCSGVLMHSVHYILLQLFCFRVQISKWISLSSLLSGSHHNFTFQLKAFYLHKSECLWKTKE